MHTAQAPRGSDSHLTRPTSQRAREGLFDWIGPRIAGERVLDLFSGSGVLGIEALSRGAECVVFVEQSLAALAALRRNIANLSLESDVRVLAQDVGLALAELPREAIVFDLILADPPYSGGWPERLARTPELVDLLAPDGVFVVERAKRDSSASSGAGLRWVRTRSYGDTAFDWYDRPSESGEAEREDD